MQVPSRSLQEWKALHKLEERFVLLSHMNETGLLWFDEETMKKHKVQIPAEYSHLLGDATGPKPKQATST